MKPEQIKRVAELVYPQYDWELSDADEVIRNESPARWHSFSPSFSDVDWRRSQALAVVEKANKLIYRKLVTTKDDEYCKFRNKLIYLSELINEENIDGIQELVLELSHE